METRSSEQILRDALETEARLVPTDALVAYLESRRDGARDTIMQHKCDPQAADRLRGLHSLACDLLRILTKPTENT